MGNERNLVKFYKWTEARRRCFYRIEDAQNESVPTIYEYRGLALRKSPMARYIQGLFGIIFCFIALTKSTLLDNFILDSFVKESAATALVLLFGYRLAQMARDNETGIYDRRFRRKIFYPMLVSRGLPIVFAYFVYFSAMVLLGKVHLSLGKIGTFFFTSSFSEVAYIGFIFLQFLIIFPFLWKFLYFRDKHQVNSRMWMLVGVYILYEIVAGLHMVPQNVHHFFFGRYLLSFSLGMLLFIRRRRGLRLWEILITAIIGLLFPTGGYFFSLWDPSFAAWLKGFWDMPFSAGVGTLLLFALLAPLVTTYRYFRMVEPSHSIVALPGKAYYNIIMVTAIVFGLEINFSVLGKTVEPQWVFLTAGCVLIGILWHIITQSKPWRYFVRGIGNTEKGLLHVLYALKKNVIIKGNRLQIRYYDRKLAVEDEV